MVIVSLVFEKSELVIGLDRRVVVGIRKRKALQFVVVPGLAAPVTLVTKRDYLRNAINHEA